MLETRLQSHSHHTGADWEIRIGRKEESENERDMIR